MREDPFRKVYRELKPNEKAHVDMIKTGAFDLLKKFPIGSPNATIAKRKLEEAVMWAVKDVTG